MKSILQSRTFWLAVTQALIGIVAVFATTYPDIGTLLVLKSLLDVILRYETTTEIFTPPVDNGGVQQLG